MKITRPNVLVAAALVASLAGCGAPESPMSSNVSDLEAGNGLMNNGLAANGLANNGLANNGLANNGLANNGLANNGLATTAFASWFATAPAYADMVMRYAVRCAVASGSSLSYTYGGTTYVWPGLLGLAPGWSAGRPATEAEQQVITACMASLSNRYGTRVPVSLQGRSATGLKIPLASGELWDFSVKEGCFFGNFFAGEGVYVGLDHGAYSGAYSSVRACAFDVSAQNTSAACPPIFQLGACRDLCRTEWGGSSDWGGWSGGWSDSGSWYSTCVAPNGKTYPAITTRLQPSSIYRCGDGVCQLTESCGTGTTFDSCYADCGACP